MINIIEITTSLKKFKGFCQVALYKWHQLQGTLLPPLQLTTSLHESYCTLTNDRMMALNLKSIVQKVSRANASLKSAHALK